MPSRRRAETTRYSRQRRRSSKTERLPIAHAFARRLSALRAQLVDDPAAAGDQALKLIEEYLEQLAGFYGYQGEGSLRRYSMFLHGKQALEERFIARIDSYTDVRNCLAHNYGLQTTPEFAAELIDFLRSLLLDGDITAERLMTGALRSIGYHAPLSDVRDLMLRDGYGRLPVVRDDGQVVGLLTERDVVVAQARADQEHRPLSQLRVSEALPDNALSRVTFVDPSAARAEIVALLQQPDVIACLVTPDGRSDQPPVGIITHADLLYRM